MNKLPLIATLLLTAVAAPAMAEKASFTHDGVTYHYTKTQVGKSVVLRGTATPGPDFHYVVRNGQVVGKNDATPVSFRVADAVAQQKDVTITFGN